METLIINIPEKKSDLVKHILKDLGVTIHQTGKPTLSDYKKKIAKLPAWSEEDIKAIEDAGKAFEGFKLIEWQVL